MSFAGSENSNAEADARRSRRQRTFFAGKVVVRDGSSSFGCVVRELTDAGARIEVPAARLLPKRFFLLTSKRQVAFDAEVAWRKDILVGLKFHSSVDLVSSLDPKLRYLKSLSAELCPRP
jgi:hypothetical protein